MIFSYNVSFWKKLRYTFSTHRFISSILVWSFILCPMGQLSNSEWRHLLAGFYPSLNFNGQQHDHLTFYFYSIWFSLFNFMKLTVTKNFTFSSISGYCPRIIKSHIIMLLLFSTSRNTNLNFAHCVNQCFLFPFKQHINCLQWNCFFTPNTIYLWSTFCKPCSLSGIFQ